MSFCKHGTYSGWQRCVPCARELKNLIEHYGDVHFHPTKKDADFALMTVGDGQQIKVRHDNIGDIIGSPLKKVFHHIVSID